MDSDIFVLITNSSFGQLTVDNGYEITIRTCIVEGSVWRKVALMEISNSTLNIIDCTFRDFKTVSGLAILNTTSVTVHVEASRFFDNIGKGGVMQISHRTILGLHRSTFDSNGIWYFAGSTILVRSESWAMIKDCNFSENIASTGGCIRAFPGSFLSVENSTFYKNDAGFGGAIYCQGNLYGKHRQNACKQPIYFTMRNNSFRNDEERTQCVIKVDPYISLTLVLK